jgi:ribosome-associated protein
MVCPRWEAWPPSATPVAGWGRSAQEAWPGVRHPPGSSCPTRCTLRRRRRSVERQAADRNFDEEVRAISTHTELAADAPSRPPAAPPSSQRELIERSLDDDQAEDVVVIDLEGKSSIADALIIASGRNGRHVAAMADHLREKMKEAGYGESPIEGAQTCDWVLVDGGDVIIHLFKPEVRAFYDIERMWGVEGPRYVAPVNAYMTDI